jgi:hypothetical protein
MIRQSDLPQVFGGVGFETAAMPAPAPTVLSAGAWEGIESEDSHSPPRIVIEKAGKVWALQGLGATVLAGAAVLASRVLSGYDISKGPVVCPLRRFLGIPCPTCGMTASFAHMGGMRIREAFLANPAGPLLFAALLIAGVSGFLVAVTARVPKIRGSFPRWLSVFAWLAGMGALALMWTAELIRFGLV